MASYKFILLFNFALTATFLWDCNICISILSIHCVLISNLEYNGDLSSSGIAGHVICCGHIEYNSLLDFLLEFYHEVSAFTSLLIIYMMVLIHL